MAFLAHTPTPPLVPPPRVSKARLHVYKLCFLEFHLPLLTHPAPDTSVVLRWPRAGPLKSEKLSIFHLRSCSPNCLGYSPAPLHSLFFLLLLDGLCCRFPVVGGSPDCNTLVVLNEVFDKFLTRMGWTRAELAPPPPPPPLHYTHTHTHTSVLWRFDFASKPFLPPTPPTLSYLSHSAK